MSKRNAPFVAIRTDIRKEERVAVIADIGGYNRYEALGRLLNMWAWCTDRGLENAPADCEGYAVSEGVIVLRHRAMWPAIACCMQNGLTTRERYDAYMRDDSDQEPDVDEPCGDGGDRA